MNISSQIHITINIIIYIINIIPLIQKSNKNKGNYYGKKTAKESGQLERKEMV